MQSRKVVFDLIYAPTVLQVMKWGPGLELCDVRPPVSSPLLSCLRPLITTAHMTMSLTRRPIRGSTSAQGQFAIANMSRICFRVYCPLAFPMDTFQSSSSLRQQGKIRWIGLYPLLLRLSLLLCCLITIKASINPFVKCLTGENGIEGFISVAPWVQLNFTVWQLNYARGGCVQCTVYAH